MDQRWAAWRAWSMAAMAIVLLAIIGWIACAHVITLSETVPPESRLLFARRIALGATIALVLLAIGFVILTVLVSRHGAKKLRASESASRAHVQQREQALRELAATEERLRLATEGAEIGTWNVDLVTGQAAWNSRTYELMGLPDDLPLTPQIRRGPVVPEDLPLLERVLEESRREKTPFHVEYRIR